MKKELSVQNICLNLRAEEKVAALQEVVAALPRHLEIEEDVKADIVEQLVERETNTTFAVGHSIAIPHLSTPSIEQFVFFYARSVEGIDFGACDHGLVHHLFFVLIPADQKCGWLKILAKMAKTLSDFELREELMNSTHEQRVAGLLNCRLFHPED